MNHVHMIQLKQGNIHKNLLQLILNKDKRIIVNNNENWF